MLITPTEHAKSEWSRMAQDAYSKGLNTIGHTYSAWASVMRDERIPVSQYDNLQRNYRAWLIDGFKA